MSQPKELVRTLSDADVDAIVDKMQAAMAKQFYCDLGRGIWGLAWKAIVVAVMAVAAYGAGSMRH